MGITQKVCAKAGVESGAITASNLISSSVHHGCNDKERWRLNAVKKDGATSGAGWAGAWCSGRRGNGEWVGVQFAQLTEVSGIITQGRQDYDQWVKRFKVGYTITEGGAVQFIKDEQGQDKIFLGNNDRDTPVEHSFLCHLNVFSVAIYPIDTQGWTSMRFEVMTCT